MLKGIFQAEMKDANGNLKTYKNTQNTGQEKYIVRLRIL